MKKTSKVLSVLCSLLLTLLLLTSAIAVPILCRPFYYAQITALDLPEQTGWSEDTIREAFDDVMDFLVKGRPFRTGALKWSDSGKSHFQDCKALFRLDFLLLAGSAAGLALVMLLSAFSGRSFHPFLGRGPCFWAFAGMTAVLALLSLWAVIDFTSLFTAFHRLFFPGRTNWLFDWRSDQIILILPEAFWTRAAALVAGLAFGSAALLAILEAVISHKHKPKNVYEEVLSMR